MHGGGGVVKANMTEKSVFIYNTYNIFISQSIDFEIRMKKIKLNRQTNSQADSSIYKISIR